MLSPQTRRNISRIIPFGIIWLVFSLIYSLLERGLLGNLDTYPSTGNPYDFAGNIFVTAISASLFGLLIGTIEILYLNTLFAKTSLSKKIVYKTVIYVGIMISFLLVNTIISNTIRLETNLFDERTWINVWVFFSNFAFWSVEIYIAAIIGTSLFYSEVSENLGQGVLHNFLTGKYHSPTQEERIFMFLDMKSSTTIAEKLGHVRYFELLKEYYTDLSDSIINHSGEVYQYVGDEIVVSWTIKNGLRNTNCIECFFKMKEALSNETEKYQLTYGEVPTFKAGFHLGTVTAGEIGVLKKEIIFTGDVLNTTARIQELCNSHNVDLLVSGSLIKKLELNLTYKAHHLGKTELRGRDEEVELYSIKIAK